MPPFARGEPPPQEGSLTACLWCNWLGTLHLLPEQPHPLAPDPAPPPPAVVGAMSSDGSNGFITSLSNGPAARNTLTGYDGTASLVLQPNCSLSLVSRNGTILWAAPMAPGANLAPCTATLGLSGEPALRRALPPRPLAAKPPALAAPPRHRRPGPATQHRRAPPRPAPPQAACL
jgi:hypothetical protein